MFIQTEATPNPATVKFLPGQPVMGPGRVAEYGGEDEAANSPLARRLLQLSGVKSVFFGNDFVSVTKDDAAVWDQLRIHILGVLMQHFSAGLPAVEGAEPPPVAPAPEDEDELSKQIRELIETRVRPAVANDGGDIVFDRFEDGIVYLHMRGACAGCPSSTMTLKSGIENMLKHFVPEVVAVENAAEF
jgi:Fe-S cluster biogenesis protein NfuA